MGMSSLSDAVTGQTFQKGEKIVAIVIARRKGGYPDAVKAAAKPGIRPDDLFVPMSLPIRAKAGDYGDIVPTKKQLAVDVLCRMTGMENWKQFSEKALDFLDGGVVLERPFMGGAGETEILGIAAYKENTWNALIEGYWRCDERAGDIALVKAAMLDAADAPREGKLPVGEASAMLGLQIGHVYTFSASTERTEMPPLAHALTEMEAVGSLGRPLVSYLHYDSGELHWDLGEKGSAKANHRFLDELLGALWENQAFHYGLYAHNRYLMPSISAGLSKNDLHVAQLSMSVIEDAMERAADVAEDYGNEDEVEKLLAVSAQLEAMQRRVEERILKAKAAVLGDEPAP